MPSKMRTRLQARKPRQTFYDLPTAGEEQLDAAERALTTAQASGDPGAVAAAVAALEACRDRLVFQALPAHEFEALIAAHEPQESDRASGDQWHAETFVPALIAACIVDSDLTEDDWKQELAGWSVAERNAIFAAAVSANVVSRSVVIPKG